MNNFKTFYNEKNGKMILFFGFYFIFFIFLFIYINNANNNKPKDKIDNKPTVEEKITSYDISNLIENDYRYSINIVDNDDVINFNGKKTNIDYANYPHKYFLDIYNINQLLKKSKFSDSNGYLLSYELNNSELNDILLTTRAEGINKIDVTVNNKTEIEKVVMDLSNYMEKDKFVITITYLVGEENENSPS